MPPSRILFLGPETPLLEWLRERGEDVFCTGDRISARFVKEQGFTILVSYGYRHILQKDILDLFPGRAINLHIAYLPWNRGADPNLWSFVENTPKGVTIHYLDEGVDTGDIIVQKEISFDPGCETLATSYEKLQTAIQDLFRRHWQEIKSGTMPGRKQAGKGTSHRARDKERVSHLLTDGWNTPVSALQVPTLSPVRSRE